MNKDGSPEELELFEVGELEGADDLRRVKDPGLESLR